MQLIWQNSSPIHVQNLNVFEAPRFISLLFNPFQETGSVKNLSKNRGSKAQSRDERIVEHFHKNPHSSSVEAARTLHTSQSTVLRVLKREKFHPYKIQMHQSLSELDFNRRKSMCQRLTALFQEDPDFLSDICFSDEATFTLDGQVNRQNFRYWSQGNPEAYEAEKNQASPRVTVWCGIWQNHVIGPYVFNSKYCHTHSPIQSNFTRKISISL